MNATAPAPIIDKRPPFTLPNGQVATLEKIRRNPGLPNESDIAYIVVSGKPPYPSAFQLSRWMGGKHVHGPVSVLEDTAMTGPSALFTA